MNTQNPNRHHLVIIALGLGMVCVGLAIWGFQSRKKLDNLQDEAVALRAKVEEANQKAAAASTAEKKRLLPATPEIQPAVATEGSGSAARTTTAKAEPKRRVNPEEMAAMMKSPMMQKIMASQTSAVMQMTYDHLMTYLQLSPEEREYMQRLLIEKQTNLQNLGMQFLNPGISDDERQSLVKQLGEAWKGGEAKIRSFLNDDADFAYYQSYSKQEPERKEVGMFESSLTGADALDAATSDALANLQSEARKNFSFTVDFYNQENFGNPAVLTTASIQKFLDEQTQFQSQVADKAAALLTPAQLQVYKQNQSAVRQMSSMQLNSIVQLAGGGQ